MRAFALRSWRPALLAAIVAATVFALAWGGIALTRENDRIAAVWLANGVTLAVLLQTRRTHWPLLLMAAWLGNLAANLVSGDALLFAASLSTINQAEAWIAALLIGAACKRDHQPFEITPNVAPFVLAAGIAAPVCSALSAAAFLWLWAGASPWSVFANWYASDALGLLIVTPLILAYRDEPRRSFLRDRAEPLFLGLLAAAAAGFVFWGTRQPFLFLLSPIIFYAALRLRLFAAMLVVCTISLVAVAATLEGHGVIARTNWDTTQRMYVLQLFLAIQLFTVLPLRALIGERDRLGAAAAQSDRLFRRISEASPAGILHLDAVGRPTFANARWRALTGQSFDQLCGDRWIDAIDPSFRGAARSIWARARATDQPTSAEFPYRCGVRNAGWAELNIYPEVDGMKLLGFVVRLTDVSGRRRAEDALAERETLYRLVTENAHDVIFRVAPGGRVQYVSSALGRLFDVDPSRVIDRPFSALVCPDDLDGVAAMLEPAATDVLDPVCRFRVRRGDGGWSWVEASFRHLFDGATGDHLETIVSMRDVDRRRQGELAAMETAGKLRERNRLLQMAEDLAQIGHWRFELQGGAFECSRHFRSIAGLDRQSSVAPADVLALVHRDDRAKTLRLLALSRKSRRPGDGAIRIVDRSGVLRHVRIGIQAERDDAGRTTGLFGILRDKSEYVAAQQELIEARDAAQAAARAKSHFLATMSHEIRTPMTGVLGMLDLLHDQPAGEERDRYFATLRQSADLLMAVLDDVLDFSKIDSGALKLEKVPFDLSELAASTVELFGNAASRKGLRLTLDGHIEHGGLVAADPVRIQQILSNLLSNAIKFTERGRVTLSLRDGPLVADRRTWSIEVRDTGIGIDPQDVDQLFQPFVQAQASTSRQFGGTGLGLSISRRLVEAMGGAMGVSSRLGRGSTFWIELPLDDATQRPETVGMRGPAPEGEQAVLNLDLLVAEDNPVNQMLIGAILRKLGHRVTIAENGRKAIERCREQTFDAILMDMQMPELDGLAATRAIRSTGGPNASGPIIALTADASPERRRFYDGVGLTHFMTKPIDRQALASLLASLSSPDHPNSDGDADLGGAPSQRETREPTRRSP